MPRPARFDPYRPGAGAVQPAPVGWLQRCRWLGPGIVISGSIVGSGELVLTSSLGAAAGFALLWWLLLACWSKSIVQAEFARYVVVSGDTYLAALNRVPGRLPGGASWTLWMVLLSFIPGVIGMGGILGGAGQALTLLVPGLEPTPASCLVTLATVAILYSGSYRRLEQTMVLLVAGFVLATLAAAAIMQATAYRVSWEEVARGFAFELPVEHLMLALAVYGATGVNAAEISTYTYWCIEKGYPGFIGAGDGRVERARGWLRVMQLDVWMTLLLLTVTTVPFYVLGAGVLHEAGLRPQGLETVSVLSAMFTSTLGGWSLWLFGGAAFCILFSSAVAGFGGTARFVPDFLSEFGWLDRRNAAARTRWIRAYGTLVPVLSLAFYLYSGNPVLLLTVGGLTAALLLPVQSGATLYLQRRHMDAALRPAPSTRLLLAGTFLFQAVMALAVSVLVLVGPGAG